MKTGPRHAIVIIVLGLAGCDGGDGGDDDPGATVARVEILQTGLILTEAGASRQLSAVAYDARDNAVAASIAWTSTTPADIDVDAGGRVTARTANGSSQVTAEAGGVRSLPLLAVVTELPAGAIALDDAQIVGDPVETDPGAEPDFDNTYRVVLEDVAAPAVGSLLINTGSKPVAGRVEAVEAAGGRTTVTLRLVSLREMLPNLRIDQRIDLSQAPVSIDPGIAATYDVQRSGNTFTFTPKSPGSSLGAAAVTGAATAAPMPPFTECEAAVTPPIQFSVPPLFSVTQTFGLDLVFTPATGLERFVVRGEVSPKVEIGLTVTAAFEGSLECTAPLFTIRIPVGGPLSLFVAGLVPVKAGFKVGGKVTVATAGLGLKAEAKATAEIGIACPNGANCAFVRDVTGEAEVTPTWDVPGFGDLRFEPSLEAFGKVELAIGNPFLNSLRLDAFYAQAGPKLAGSFAPHASQILATDYKSDYKASFEVKAGVGKKLGEAMELLGLETLSALELTGSVDIARSPRGSVTADKATFVAGETVTFHVALEPGTVDFYPVLGPYNVDEVLLVRQAPGSVQFPTVGRVPATGGQTGFDIPFTATDAGTSGEFTVFVVTALLPLDVFSLEIGKVREGRLTLTKGDYVCVAFGDNGFCDWSSVLLTVTAEAGDDASGFDPVPGVTVSITSSCASPEASSGQTDAQGRFSTRLNPIMTCADGGDVHVVATAPDGTAFAQKDIFIDLED